MNWNITIKPYSSALTMWGWTAVREDQENQLSGAGYETKQEAMDAAQVDVQAFEDTQGVIKAATQTYTFEPVIPVLPDLEVPEVPLP